MNVAAYIRVSTDGQVGEDKFGLDSQRMQIEDYCSKNDMTIIKWFADEGESGAKYRPGFDEIVYGDVSNPPYEAVVVAKSDRVARDINIYFYYQGALLRKGIELISICEDFGQFGVFANMLKAFTLTCAEMERENIKKRTMAGRAVKSSNGGYVGGRPPYGYMSQNGSLVVNQAEAEVVKRILRERAAGRNLKDIRDGLNADGVLTRGGKEWQHSTVANVCNNRKLYEGYHKHSERGWIKGQHEAIV